VPGGDGEPVQYSADLGPLRLVALDTTIPGQDAGQLDAARLAWLDAELARAPEQPTLIAMHHPPLVGWMPAFEDIVLPDADRRALAEVVEGHPQVRRIVAGHVHCVLATELAGRPVLTVPSTYVQLRLGSPAEGIGVSDDDPPGMAWHVMVDGELVSHVQPCASPD
jgi:3',5'-cyclic AMP phosphodiesterase CpdA